MAEPIRIRKPHVKEQKLLDEHVRDAIIDIADLIPLVRLPDTATMQQWLWLQIQPRNSPCPLSSPISLQIRITHLFNIVKTILNLSHIVRDG